MKLLYSEEEPFCTKTKLNFKMIFWFYKVYELSGCGFESSCSHLNLRFRVCFEQGVP